VAVCGLLTLAVGRVATQEPQVKDDLKFWDDPRRAAAAATAEIVGIREPIAAFLMWDEVKSEIVPRIPWQPPPPPKTAPPLDPRVLANVLDDQPMPMLAGRQRDEWRKWEAANYDIFSQAVLAAAQTPPEAFAKSARENESLAWGTLFTNVHKHRGKVIPFKGRLKMLRRQDPPVAVEHVVHDLYEGWVFTDTPNSRPVWVVFPTLPPGVKPGEKVNYEVSFNAYLLMRIRYVTGYLTPEGKNQLQRTILVVAPTITVPGGPDPTRSKRTEPTFGQMSGFILTGLIILVVGTVLLVFGLGWWFRRGDRRFQSHLNQVKADMFSESALGGEPPPPEGPPRET
jgi:hypothetical protein